MRGQDTSFHTRKQSGKKGEMATFEMRRARQRRRLYLDDGLLNFGNGESLMPLAYNISGSQHSLGYSTGLGLLQT